MNSRDWESLIQRHLDGIATREEVTELSEQLESDADTRLLYLRLARIHATLAADELDEPSDSESENRLLDLITQLDSFDKRQRTRRLVLSVVAAAAMIALMAGVFFLRPSDEPQIATIAAVDGAIQGTGAGGQVSYVLESGRPLTGGTLESLSVDSLAELVATEIKRATNSWKANLATDAAARHETGVRLQPGHSTKVEDWFAKVGTTFGRVLGQLARQLQSIENASKRNWVMSVIIVNDDPADVSKRFGIH